MPGVCGLKKFGQILAMSSCAVAGMILGVADLHGAAAQPVQAAGYLDALTGTYAAGWGCVPGQNLPVNIAVYAGAHRIGIYPPTVSRPDTAGACGPAASTAGFRIELTPIVAQQFLYQSNLTFFALAPGANPALLPSSDSSFTDPAPLPTGEFTNLTQAGVLSGLVTGAGNSAPAPNIDVFAGGPAGSGGQLIGRANVAAIQTGTATQSFSAALPAGTLAGLPAGYVPALFAMGSYGGGPTVQLGSPAVPGAGFIPLYADLMQTGAVSGITSTIYTHWVGGNYVFTGLSGSVSFTGNDPSFSEALLTVGFTNDSRLACAQENATSPATVPPFSRLAGVILKSNDTIGDTLPVSVTLPYGVPLAGAKGSCLLLWVSAGYPFLSPYAAKYANTKSQLAVMLTPAASNGPVTIAEGIGNEFRFPAGSAGNDYTIVSMRLNKVVALDAIAGSVSAGGIAGAPGGTNLLPSPSGNWTAATSFYVLNANDCSALGLSYGPGNPYFAVARADTPAVFSIPADARLLVAAPLYGLTGIVSEQTFFQTFGNPGASSAVPITLQPGECLIAFHNVVAPGGNLDGVLDLENQSTVYFHLLQ